MLIFLCVLGLLTTPLLTFAQDSTVNRLGITYQTMVDIPGVADETTGEVTVASYLNILYAIAVVAAALMAVVRIVLAGAKYMLSDVVTTKGQAINDIQSGIIGLLIIICAVLILGTINPDLGDIRFVENVRPVGDVHNVGGSTQAGSGGSTINDTILSELSCTGTAADTTTTCNSTTCQGEWIVDESQGIGGCQGYTESPYDDTPTDGNDNPLPTSQVISLNMTNVCSDITNCSLLDTYIFSNFTGMNNKTDDLASAYTVENGYVRFDQITDVNFDGTMISGCQAAYNGKSLVVTIGTQQYYACFGN